MAMQQLSDSIQQILQRVAEVWQVDDNRVQWSKPSAQDTPGFDWWPGDFRVRVRAHWPLETEAGSAVKIIVRTNFLKDVAIGSDRFETMTTMMAGYATSTYAWIYPPRALWQRLGPLEEGPALWFNSSAYVTSR